MATTRVIDGLKCTCPATTAAEFTSSLGFSRPWQGNLDALDDMLYGGFGTPGGGFILVRNHAKRSEAALGPLSIRSWPSFKIMTTSSCNSSDYSTPRQSSKTSVWGRAWNEATKGTENTESMHGTRSEFVRGLR